MTDVEGERFRTRGKVTVEAGWRGVYGLEAAAERPVREGGPGEGAMGEPEVPPRRTNRSWKAASCRGSSAGQRVRCVSAESEAKETKPPPRYTEATLLSAMETAGKLIGDEELREAMKERGLGTPATRAETIETLIRREYIERAGRDLQATPKGIQVITMIEGTGSRRQSSPATGRSGSRDIERGQGDRSEFMKQIEELTRRRSSKSPRSTRRSFVPSASSLARARAAARRSARTRAPTAARAGRARRSPAAAS